MGWFSRKWKQIKKNVKKVSGAVKKVTGITYLEGMKDGISGKAAAEAAKQAAKQAAEEARQQRVASVQGQAFAEADAAQVGANVSLGTADTDLSLEEQLKRMRGGK